MDRILRFHHKITLLLEKANISEKTIICTQKCTLPENSIIKTLKTHGLMYVFRSRAARAAFGSGNDFFRQSDNISIQNHNLAEKYTFVQKLARVVSGAKCCPIWTRKSILRSGPRRQDLNHITWRKGSLRHASSVPLCLWLCLSLGLWVGLWLALCLCPCLWGCREYS